ADEQRNDHVREHHDIAQRQHRIDPGFTRRDCGSWFRKGHGPKPLLLSLLLCPSATTRQGAVTAECQWAGKGTRKLSGSRERWRVRHPAGDRSYAIRWPPTTGVSIRNRVETAARGPAAVLKASLIPATVGPCSLFP